jgi:chaperonin cofactor prefoldin
MRWVVRYPDCGTDSGGMIQCCSRLSKEVHMFGSRDINPPEKVVIGGTIGNLQRGHRSLVVGLLLLALALTGGGWYAYQVLNRHEVALTNIVVAMSDQVKSTGEMVASWADDKKSLHDQIAKLDQTMETRIAAVTNQTLAFTSEMYRRIQAEIDDRMKRIDTRLAQIESSSESQQTRIEELQRELGEVRSQAPKQADDLAAAVGSKVGEIGATQEREYALPQQSEEANRREETNSREEADHRHIDAFGHKLTVHRVDFEITKNHSRQLTQGISLGVVNTDTLHRSASGWMWVMPERRTIWLKAQNAGEPLVFYDKDDGKKRELVITNVTDGSITGYLLLAESGAGRKIASVQSNK